MAESIVRKFYGDLAKGKIWGQQCMDCNAWNFPPKGSCNSCGSLKVQLEEVSGEGKLIVYSVGYLPPKKFEDFAPYAYGMVELKEGPIFMTQIRGVPMKTDEIREWNENKLPVDVEAKIEEIAGMNIVIFEVK